MKIAVAEMLSAVCGESISTEDCTQAASVFATVVDKHTDSMRAKYDDLLTRHKYMCILFYNLYNYCI